MSKFLNGNKKRFEAAYLPDPYSYYCQHVQGVKGRADAKQAKALCPFHNENTPSFTWQNADGKWKCFGCGEGGSLLDFHIKYTGYSFVEACKDLGCWR